MQEKVISPCISICRTDPVTGYCYGCARTSEEKKLWKDESTNNQWKEENIKLIINRMQGYPPIVSQWVQVGILVGYPNST